ncbi:autophagy-related protein 16-like [Agrilus planipennis]|uniref:Autophagy-related protein 16-like n=1 Tax=Agrilus planipennis TaxID=224129 RepID=A0A1W4WMU5_AGRPL|nr:autophagy-related protein 16-like [Agrilus planipennis]
MEEESNWRNSIHLQLQNRNKYQTERFQDLIAFQNKLFDHANSLRIENVQLSVQLEKFKEGFVSTSTPSVNESRLHERIQQLEHKLMTQQEELTDLHKRKGENAQQIIDLNSKLQEREKMLASKEVSLAESLAQNQSLRTEIRRYQNSIKELENLNQIIRDEHQALQIAFASLEDKLRKAQEENRQLVERLINYKAKDADRMNEENDNFLNESSKRSSLFLGSFTLFRKRNAKVQKELEDATKDARAVSPDDMICVGAPCQSVVPTKCIIKFEAHDGEVNAVRWSHLERLVATGGADRRVKLWDVSKGSYELRGVLVGSNAGVMSVEFDNSGTLLLGASNDFASRVWTISDFRLRKPFVGTVPVTKKLCIGTVPLTKKCFTVFYLSISSLPVTKKLFIGTMPLIKKPFIGTVPVTKKLCIGTVPLTKKLFTVSVFYLSINSVPVTKKLFIGTIPVIKKPFIGTVAVTNNLCTGTVPVTRNICIGTVPVTKELFIGTIPVIKKPFVGTVPVTKKLCIGTVPVTKELFIGTIPVIKKPFVGTVPVT